MFNKPIYYLIVFALLILIIVYAGISFYQNLFETEKYRAHNNLSTLAKLKINQMQNWRNERISDALFIQQNQEFKKQIFHFIQNPDDLRLKKEIIKWITPIKENHEYVDIIIIKKDYSAYSLFNQDYKVHQRDSIYLLSSFRENKIILAGFYKSPVTNQISMGSYIPLSLSRGKDIFGFIKIKIDPQTNLYPLIQSVSINSKTAETFLVHRDGDSVTFLNNLRFKKNTALSFRLPLSLQNLPAAMAVNGKTGIFEGTDYNGNKVLADLNRIPDSPWFIISKINLNEVYAHVKEQLYYIIAGGLTLIFIIGFVIITLWNNQRISYLHNQLLIEKELHKKELQFFNIIETAMDGVITLDENQHIILFNKASEKIFKVKAEEAMGEHISKFIPARFHNQHKENIAAFGKDSTEARYMGNHGIIPGILGTGEEVLMEASISHFEIEGSNFYTVIHRDITEQKRVEDALHQSERDLRSFFEAGLLGVKYWKMDGQIVDANNKFLEMVGYTREEMLTGQLNCFRMTPPEYRIQDEQFLNELKTLGNIKLYEKEYIRKNGTSLPILLGAAIVDEQRSIAVAFVLDITERKHLEQELKESEQRVKRKLDSILLPEGDIGDLDLSDIIDINSVQFLMNSFYQISHIPMSIIDLKGKVLVSVGSQNICTEYHRLFPGTNGFCMDSESHLSNYTIPGDFKLYKCKNNMWDVTSPIMIAGRHVGNIFIGQFFFEDEHLDSELFRAHARKYGFDEDEYINSIGTVPRVSEVVLTSCMEYFRNFSNLLSRLSFSNIKLARLLSERDVLMNSLKLSQEDLKRSNKDLEEFAYTASHDLQEPVRMIMSYSQLVLMKEKESLSESAVDFLQFIQEGAGRMKQLIDDLLKYSRLSTTKQQFEEINCNLIVRDVLNDLKFKIDDENAQIQVSELPSIKGVETQLRQLFQNFIHNALKFRSERTPEIKINCEKRDHYWLFSVTDNGIGIEQKYYERIFIIFQRLHDREKYPGTGIGLALCKKIVERHGGQICVESEPGTGTVFYFTLPV